MKPIQSSFLIATKIPYILCGLSANFLRAQFVTFDGKDIEREHVYLIQCHSSTTQEIVFRVKHRDGWVKTQFIAQLSIVALGLGISFGQVKAEAIYTNAFILSFPISLIIASFYFIEENIISLMSRYLSDLDSKRCGVQSNPVVANFDASQYASDFFSETQYLRVAAQTITFIGLPMLITIYDWSVNHYEGLALDFRLGVAALCFFALLGVMVVTHKARAENLNSKSQKR